MLFMSAAVMIDLMVLLKGLLAIAGIVALSYLGVVLYRLANVLKSVQEITDKAVDPVVDAVEQLNPILEKANVIMDNVTDITDDIAMHSQPVMADVSRMTSSIERLVEALSDLGVDTSNLVDRGVNFFGGGKKRSGSSTDSTITKVIAILSSILGIIRAVKKNKDKKKK